MKTPKDFDFLSEQIFERQHETVSASTLKRIWGYLPGRTPRQSSLDILSRFAGHTNWEAFLGQTEAQPKEVEVKSPLPQPQARTKKALPKWLWPLSALLILVVGWFVLRSLSPASERRSGEAYTLKKGQTFATMDDYLKLFGVSAADTLWYQTVPHHPSLHLWGPQYHHPRWHNEGDAEKLLPTITEWWEPEYAAGDPKQQRLLSEMNRQGYYMSRRLNDLRITFMRGLTSDSAYTFLGAYRMSLAESDTAHIVWERVADEVDLEHLDYLEQLRN